MKLFLLAAFCGTALSLAHAAPVTLNRDGASFTFDPELGVGSHLEIAASPVNFEGTFPLWEMQLYDQAARKANTLPLKGRGYYWQTPWVYAGGKIDSRKSKLVAKKIDPAKGTAELSYETNLVKVNLTLRLEKGGLFCSGGFTNKQADPITDFAVLADLKFRLGANDTVIVPDFGGNGLEYSRIHKQLWSM
ncbi:MAG: hypothetical protein PHS41_06025, partial [Victivallaceae bacterium]|nr:hypothetical protein [Victivallaceae bacterium]